MDSSGFQNWRELANSLHTELVDKNSMFDLKEVCSWIGVTQKGNLKVISARLTEFLLTEDVPDGRPNLEFIEKRLTIDSEVWRSVKLFRASHPKFKPADANFISLLAPPTIYLDDEDEDEEEIDDDESGDVIMKEKNDNHPSQINNNNNNNNNKKKRKTTKKKRRRRRKKGTGRKAIEIKYIEDSNRRNRIYSKRKIGIFKKFVEIGILCGADFMVCIESPSGRSNMRCSSSFQTIGEDVLRKMKVMRKIEREEEKKKKKLMKMKKSQPLPPLPPPPPPQNHQQQHQMKRRRRKKKKSPPPPPSSPPVNSMMKLEKEE